MNTYNYFYLDVGTERKLWNINGTSIQKEGHAN